MYEDIDPTSLQEWLEADGLGGFSSGTEAGLRTRRYHALLTTATTPPTGRYVLVANVEAWVETPQGSFDLSSHIYHPNVIHPSGLKYLTQFRPQPWPTWNYTLPNTSIIEHSLFSPWRTGDVILRWSIKNGAPAKLYVRPLLAGRNYHHLLNEQQGFNSAPKRVSLGNVSWQPHPSNPAMSWLSNGKYQHQPSWYRQFLYPHEQERGLDHIEDLASPGVFVFDLSEEQSAHVVLRPGDSPYGDAESIASLAREHEHSRRKTHATTPCAYLAQRGQGESIIAGFPWFTDWGRDTFISMRGLCLAEDNLALAHRIIDAWSEAVSMGMLPNRFPDSGIEAEYNAADASLWFVVVVGELAKRLEGTVPHPWTEAVAQILVGYKQGTRFAIRVDEDGLLAAGVPGQQLTWMDAKVGDDVMTPRIGKPVELQALWVNALFAGEQLIPAQSETFNQWRTQAEHTFRHRFVKDNPWLPDVVDTNHQPGYIDTSLRPNLLFAVGGLPVSLVDATVARKCVDIVEQQLVVPGGVRTLTPSAPNYRGRYTGGPRQRDEAYHQGTAWPWLLGPFIEAWLRTRTTEERSQEQHKQIAHHHFFAPWTALQNGSGHFPEIIEGDAPHRPVGAPFQAWSLGEWLRVRQLLKREAIVSPLTGEKI